jgi:hypothetical protein
MEGAGLTTAVAAIVGADDVYDRSVLIRSRLSRLIIDSIPLCDSRSVLYGPEVEAVVECKIFL